MTPVPPTSMPSASPLSRVPEGGVGEASSAVMWAIRASIRRASGTADSPARRPGRHLCVAASFSPSPPARERSCCSRSSRWCCPCATARWRSARCSRRTCTCPCCCSSRSRSCGWRTGPERRARSALRLALATCAVVALVRFGTIWVSLPASAAADTTRMGVTSWNLELGEADPAVVTDALRGAERGVIGLEELTPRHAAAIAVGSGHQVTLPVRVDVPQGRLAGPRPPEQHPDHGRLLGSASIRRSCRAGSRPAMEGWSRSWSRTHCPQISRPSHRLTSRSATTRPTAMRHLAAVRAAIDPLLAGGGPFVLLGDFNVTDREPGYQDLRDGGPGAVRLTDAHARGGPGAWIDMATTGRPMAALRPSAHRHGVHGERRGAYIDLARLHAARQRPLHPPSRRGVALKLWQLRRTSSSETACPTLTA